MTDKHDKLVEAAQAAGFCYVGGTLFAHDIDLTPKLAAFASAHVASLCADVEPVAWLVEWEYLAVQEWRGGQKTARETWAKCGTMVDSVDEAIALIPEEKVWRNKTVSTLYPASTVAAITAQRDAALARVAELEKDAARYQWLRDGDICADYPYPVMRTGGWQDGQTIWADELDAAIDAFLTKGQP